MRKLNIGILGTAGIAKKAVIPALLNLSEEFNIIGVGGRDLKRTQAFCEPFSIQAFDSYEALINDPKIEAVYIPLPNALHYEWVMKSLDKGLHVMCEKSLGCSQKEFEAMVNKAQEKGLLIMEHFQFRFHNQLTFIKSKIAALGELRTIRSSFCIPPFAYETNIRYQKHLGGGALLDNGAYPIKLAQQLLGNDLVVETASVNNGTHEVDIWGDLSIRDVNSGVSLQAVFGFDHIYRCDLEIIGSQGRLITDRIYTAPANHKPKVWIEKQEGYNIEKVELELPEDNHFKNIWSYFHELITEKRNFEGEYQQNLKQAHLIQQAINLSYGK